MSEISVNMCIKILFSDSKIQMELSLLNWCQPMVNLANAKAKLELKHISIMIPIWILIYLVKKQVLASHVVTFYILFHK